MKPTPFVVLVCLFALGCGESAPTEVGNTDTTTPSDIPEGADLPPVPRPQAYLDNSPNQSDVVTTVEAFDGSSDFTPEATLITGQWLIKRYITNANALGNEVPAIESCRHTVHNNVTARSDALTFPGRRVDCVNPLSWESVDYPGQGRRLNNFLQANPPRVPLLALGVSNSPTLALTIHDGRHVGHGEIGTFIDPRDACFAGSGTVLQPPCAFFLHMDVDVVARPLTNPVYLKRERFWEKAGSKRFQGSAGVTQTSVSYSYTSGSDSTTTAQFAYTVGGELGLSKGPATAKVSGSVTNTFTTSNTVTQSASVTEAWNVTIDEDDDVVFEVWNLVERYTFVNADGTPFADPNYTFSLPSLTNRANTGEAYVSTSFPAS